MTEELKQKFSEFYKKRESFYESHKDMAEKIGFKDWQKNEMFQYYEKGATEATKELQKKIEELTIKNNGLKSDCDAYNYSQQTYQEQIKGLQGELENWKSEWQEQVQKAVDEGYARTQLQIENDKLKKQIEKMKCCNNCKYKNINWSFQPICTVRKNDDRDIENPITCKCKKWELAEN